MKYFITCFILFSSIFMVKGQDKEAIAKALEESPSMEVNDELLQLNKGTQNGFSSYLNAEKESAEKQWKEFIEAKYQIELKKSKKGLIAENVSMPDISSSPITLTTIFLEDEKGCKMNVFYNMNGQYLNSKDHPKEALAIMEKLKKHQKSLYVKVYQKTIDDQRKVHEKEQKTLLKLEKEQDKLAKEMTSEEEDILKAEQTISDSEKKITELQAKMEELRGEIEQSNFTIEQLKGSLEKKNEEIEKQKGVLASKAAKIEKLKMNSERINK